MPRRKLKNRPKPKLRKKVSSGKQARRALPISEEGMRTLAMQINRLLARADAELMSGGLDLDVYTRLAGVLVRLVEVGLKCEKHRNDGQGVKGAKAGLGAVGMEALEGKLRLF